MMKSVEIKGFRGFGETGTLNFAVPNGKEGSGLTVLVGPNNSGKSSIIESLKAVSRKNQSSVSFSDGKRNKVAGDRVYIRLESIKGGSITLATKSVGGSEAVYIEDGYSRNELSLVVIPSRRTFNPFFSKNTYSRANLLLSDSIESQRGSTYQHFASRIFQIQENPEKFNVVASKIFNPLPEWTVDLADNGNYFIKFNSEGNYHNSDGTGEGLLSVFTIIDSLYDSLPGDVIVIDEPELSLHPSLQKKVCNLLSEYATDRQIVISTHSPYFIDWITLINGGLVARIVKEKGNTRIYELPNNIGSSIQGLLNNLNNPHILGLNAKELFFLEENINVVEGQEDVIFLPKVFENFCVKLTGTFYGWGIGGAQNLEVILTIIKHLGFKKAVIILDNNMNELKDELRPKFPNYLFLTIPTNDVRDKDAVKPRDAVKGLIDTSGKKADPTHKDAVMELSKEMEKYHKG